MAFSGEPSGFRWLSSFEEGPCGRPPPPVQVSVTFFSSHGFQRATLLALAVSSALAAFFFLLLTYYVILLRFRSFLRRRRRAALLSPAPADPPPHNPTDGDPVVHHVWYIRTAGLDAPTIDSIAVCEYKPGDGLVDSTDCTVCLAEFEEGDLLRLLPKCGHAFHVPCIDTWLRAHVSCPLCRAPVVCAAPEDEGRDGSPPNAAEEAVLAPGEAVPSESRSGFLQDLGSSSPSSSGREMELGLVASEGDANWVTIDLNDDDRGFRDHDPDHHHLQQQQQIIRRSVSIDASAMAALMAVDRKTDAGDCAAKETACVAVASSSPQKDPDGIERCQSANGRRFFLPRFARGRSHSASILPL